MITYPAGLTPYFKKKYKLEYAKQKAEQYGIDVQKVLKLINAGLWESTVKILTQREQKPIHVNHFNPYAA